MTNYLKSLFRHGGGAGRRRGGSGGVRAGLRLGAWPGRRLECKLSGDKVAIIVEERTVDRLFEDESGAPPVHYVGSVTDVGAVIGVGGPGELAWRGGGERRHRSRRAVRRLYRRAWLFRAGRRRRRLGPRRQLQ